MSEQLPLGLSSVKFAIEQINKFYDRQIQYQNEERTKTIRRVERNRLIIPLLHDIVGTDAISVYGNGETIYVNLGSIHKTKRDKRRFVQTLIEIRKVVGPLKPEDKSLVSPKARTIRITLTAKEFPGLQIRYVTKLPQQAQCRIVKQKQRSYTSHHLVCDGV